jgi:hypothetical protein
MGTHIPNRREPRSKAIVRSTKYSVKERTLGGLLTGGPTLCLAGVVGAVLGIVTRLGISWAQLVGPIVIAHIGLSLLMSRCSGVRFLIAQRPKEPDWRSLELPTLVVSPATRAKDRAAR